MVLSKGIKIGIIVLIVVAVAGSVIVAYTLTSRSNPSPPGPASFTILVNNPGAADSNWLYFYLNGYSIGSIESRGSGPIGIAYTYEYDGYPETVTLSVSCGDYHGSTTARMDHAGDYMVTIDLSHN